MNPMTHSTEAEIAAASDAIMGMASEWNHHHPPSLQRKLEDNNGGQNDNNNNNNNNNQQQDNGNNNNNNQQQQDNGNNNNNNQQDNNNNNNNNMNNNDGNDNNNNVIHDEILNDDYEDIDYSDYEFSTIDPGYIVDYGTLGLCLLIGMLSGLFLLAVQRRRNRQAAALHNQKLSPISSTPIHRAANDGMFKTSNNNDNDDNDDDEPNDFTSNQRRKMTTSRKIHTSWTELLEHRGRVGSLSREFARGKTVHQLEQDRYYSADVLEELGSKLGEACYSTQVDDATMADIVATPTAKVTNTTTASNNTSSSATKTKKLDPPPDVTGQGSGLSRQSQTSATSKRSAATTRSVSTTHHQHHDDATTTHASIKSHVGTVQTLTTGYEMMDDLDEAGLGDDDDDDDDGAAVVAMIPENALDAFFRYTQALFRYDREMRKLLELAIPYTISSVTGSVLDLISMGLIGQLMGTRALSAYIMVYYVIALSTMGLDGLLSTVSVVCSQAIGSENYQLAGQFVQIAFFLYTIGLIPQILLWWYYMAPVVEWFDFDEETAVMAQDYARVYLVRCFVAIGDSCIGYLLEVAGYEKSMTVFGILHQATCVGAVFGVVMYGYGTLQYLAMAELVVDIIFMIAVTIYIRQRGFFDLYWDGLFGSFALTNMQAVSVYLKSGIPISIGYILSDGEWEILFFLAGYMGAAELAAWGVLGELWGALEGLTTCWADAAEVRCSRLLGGGRDKAGQARLSAHKAMLLGMIVAIAGSITIFVIHDRLPGWITADVTMQAIVSELLPLAALGNITLALGTISYQLVGAQARYSVATLVQFIGSWFITLPLAILSTVYLHWNLRGMVAAVVLGYMVSGTLNFIIILVSDWEVRADKIRAKNLAAGEEESSSSDEEGDEEAGGDEGPEEEKEEASGQEGQQEETGESETKEQTVEKHMEPSTQAAEEITDADAGPTKANEETTASNMDGTMKAPTKPKTPKHFAPVEVQLDPWYNNNS